MASGKSKGKPNMKVTAVSGSFDSLQTNGRVDVRGDIQNRGRAAGRAIVRIVLRGNGAEFEIASASARVKAKAKKPFAASGSVASSLARGLLPSSWPASPSGGRRARPGAVAAVGSIQVTGGSPSPRRRSTRPGPARSATRCSPRRATAATTRSPTTSSSTTTRSLNDFDIRHDDDERDGDPGPLELQPRLPGHGRVRGDRQRRAGRIHPGARRPAARRPGRR